MSYKSFIPNVIEHQIGELTIFFYEEDQNFLLGYKELSTYLLRFADLKKFKYCRLQLNIKTVDFLVGIDREKKQVSFLSPRAHRELFLLRNVDPKNLSEDNQEKLAKVKLHTERVLSMDLYEFPTSIDLITEFFKLPDLDSDAYSYVDQKITNIRENLTKDIEKYSPGVIERISDYGLTLTANYDLLRVHLLKYVAILPSLDFDKSGTEVKRLFVESLTRLISDSAKAEEKGLKGTKKALPGSLIFGAKIALFLAKSIPAKSFSQIVRYAICKLGRRFIAGETIEDAKTCLKDLINSNRDATLDQLGELVVSQKEADFYRDEVLKLVKGFASYIEKGEKNISGISKAHVSIKVSALSNQFNPFAFDHTYEDVAPRLKEILVTAKEYNVFINIDAEHYHYRDLVFDIYKKVLLETPELKDYDQTGIVVQAYLRDGFKHLNEVCELAKERGLTMPIRLVKGAYWDAETIEADAHSFDAPQFLNKEETDIFFRQLIIKTFEFHPHLQLAIAGHNLRDHCFARVVREEEFPHTPEIEHQCLHMTYEALSVGMAKMGWCVRNYVPVGSLIMGMAYLVRRIMENSSQVGVLTQMRSHKKSFEILGPHQILEDYRTKKTLVFDKSISEIRDHFFSNSPVRLYKRNHRELSLEALNDYKNNKCGQHLKNEAFSVEQKQNIYSSSDPSLLVGSIDFANKEIAENCAKRSFEAYKEGSWANMSVGARASIFLAAAHELNLQRLELSALISLEAGKAFPEALADVDEAVDFLNYYVRSYYKKMRVNPDFISRGPIAVIGPWNFPIAIPCGMAAAPLIAGNTVVLKSAEQTPLISQRLVDILHDVGVPKDVLIHLPGEGETVGQALVDSNFFAGYVFTGSKAVGLHIAKSVSGRYFDNPVFNKQVPVKVITEMGGKNAIIVTANAELDETVEGVLYSAFAHAGQKCSACSRVIVDNKIKDLFIERFKQAANDIEVGSSLNPETFINPLINAEEKKRLYKQSEEIEEEAKKYNGVVHVNRVKEDLPGQCVGPLVAELPLKRAFEEDSYARRELFAPVVHVIGYDELDEAIELFNCTEYGLTGGIYSQSQDDIDYMSSQLVCGNLYINRPNTGARVGIEPFGGMKLSGTGPKAGSRYYMNCFLVDSQNLTEVTTLSYEKGSDYEFDLARPSGLPLFHRVNNFLEGFKLYLNQFEGLYNAVYIHEKESLELFYEWSQDNLFNFLNDHRENVAIPGQISFDDLSLTSEYVYYYANNLKPNPKLLLSLLSAMACGSGITIVCRSQKTYHLWSNILDCFYTCGLSESNVAVFFASQERFEKSLKIGDISIYLFDCSLEEIEKFDDLIYDESEVNHMKKIITQNDAPHVSQYKDYLIQFILNRSFAINTMRHGAPLEVEL